MWRRLVGSSVAAAAGAPKRLPYWRAAPRLHAHRRSRSFTHSSTSSAVSNAPPASPFADAVDVPRPAADAASPSQAAAIAELEAQRMAAEDQMFAQYETLANASSPPRSGVGRNMAQQLDDDGVEIQDTYERACHINRAVFGNQELLPAQRRVVRAALDGNHVMVLLPTGAGKSLCYQLPALAEASIGYTVVVSPLLALISDQMSRLRASGVAVAAMTGKTSTQARAGILRILQNYDKQPPDQRFSILFVTPERFCRDKDFRAALLANAGPASPARSVTLDGIGRMKVAELKAELKRLGQRVGGKKSELVSRLRDCVGSQRADESDIAPEDPKLHSSESVDSMSTTQRRFRRLVVDEAHCISEWGDGFRPEYHEVCSVMRSEFSSVPVMLLTGSATESISRDILARFGLTLDASWESTLISAAKMDAVNADRSGVDQVPAYEPGLQGARASLPLVVVRTSVDRPNLAFHVRSKDGLEVDEVCAMIAEDIGHEPSLVYTLTRADAEKVAQQLRDYGISAEHYHATLPHRKKDRLVAQWMNSQNNDGLTTLCATVAFGLGIDKSNVRNVVHYSLPTSLSNYYQQAGRSGRDGAPARCTLLYAPGDAYRAKRIVHNDRGDSQHRSGWGRKLDPSGSATGGLVDAREELARMVSFCEFDDACRRQSLLRHFGEAEAKTCLDSNSASLEAAPASPVQLCDVCLNAINDDSDLVVPPVGNTAEQRQLSDASESGTTASRSTSRRSSARDAVAYLQSKFPAVTTTTTITGKFGAAVPWASKEKLPGKKLPAGKRKRVRSLGSSRTNPGLGTEPREVVGAVAEADPTEKYIGLKRTSIGRDYDYNAYIQHVKRDAQQNGSGFRKSLCVSSKVFQRVAACSPSTEAELQAVKGVGAQRAGSLWSFLAKS